MRPIGYARIFSALVVGTFSCIALAGPVKEDYAGAAFEVKDNGNSQGFTTGRYGDTKTFTVGPNSFRISLTPLTPLDRSNPNTSSDVDFKNVLQTAFPTWTFKYFAPDNTTDLSLANDTLVVRAYDTKFTSQNVKTDFYVKYAGATPATGTSLHWIQVIKTNWKLPNSLYTFDNKVDNLGAANPYYDTLATASGSLGDPDPAYFWDTPSRDSADLSGYADVPLYWYAELYLAKETAANTVEIYDGVRWGWTVVPEPICMPVIAMILAGAIARKNRSLAS